MIFAGNSKYIIFAVSIADMIFLIISFFMAGIICLDESISKFSNYYLWLLTCQLLWLVVALCFNLFEVPRVAYMDRIIYKNLKALFVFTLSVVTILFFSSIKIISREFVAVLIISFTFLSIFGKIILVSFVKRYRKYGYNFRNVVIIGFNENAEKVIQKILVNPNYGFRLKGLFTDGSLVPYSNLFYRGKLDEILNYCDNNQIDELMISLPSDKNNLINELLRYGENNMMRVTIIPEFSEYLSQIFTMDYFDGIPMMKIRTEPLENLANKIIKRIFDIVFSWFVIIFIFTWLFPIIALAIKFTSKGPVFFMQMRSGKNGKKFECYKFRSMYVNGYSDSVQASKNDSRITPVGKFLRKTSLDELPQFFNVIKRNMSVVGPRPHMIKHTDDYKKIINKFMVRHYAKPGITGWAQIKGFRGETKEIKDMENRAKADIWYIENWNIFLDLKIIFLTSWQIFFKKDENAC